MSIPLIQKVTKVEEKETIKEQEVECRCPETGKIIKFADCLKSKQFILIYLMSMMSICK